MYIVHTVESNYLWGEISEGLCLIRQDGSSDALELAGKIIIHLPAR